MRIQRQQLPHDHVPRPYHVYTMCIEALAVRYGAIIVISSVGSNYGQGPMKVNGDRRQKKAPVRGPKDCEEKRSNLTVSNSLSNLTIKR